MKEQKQRHLGSNKNAQYLDFPHKITSFLLRNAESWLDQKKNKTSLRYCVEVEIKVEHKDSHSVIRIIWAQV